MSETIVLKPSKKMVQTHNLDSLSDIIRNKVANGFYACKRRADKCSDVIITDGDTAYIAKIVSIVQTYQVAGNGTNMPRVSIKFDNPEEINNTSISNIKWSSRNVRYIRI